MTDWQQFCEVAEVDPAVERVRSDLASVTREIVMIRRVVDEIQEMVALQAAEEAQMLALQAAEEKRRIDIEQWRIERQNARRRARVATELSRPRSLRGRLLLPRDVMREALKPSRLPPHPHPETGSTADSESADG